MKTPYEEMREIANIMIESYRKNEIKIVDTNDLCDRCGCKKEFLNSEDYCDDCFLALNTFCCI